MCGDGEHFEVWNDDSDKTSGVVDKLGANKRVQLSAEKRSSSDALVP